MHIVKEQGQNVVDYETRLWKGTPAGSERFSEQIIWIIRYVVLIRVSQFSDSVSLSHFVNSGCLVLFHLTKVSLYVNLRSMCVCVCVQRHRWVSSPSPATATWKPAACWSSVCTTTWSRCVAEQQPIREMETAGGKGGVGGKWRWMLSPRTNEPGRRLPLSPPRMAVTCRPSASPRSGSPQSGVFWTVSDLQFCWRPLGGSVTLY